MLSRRRRLWLESSCLYIALFLMAHSKRPGPEILGASKRARGADDGNDKASWLPLLGARLPPREHLGKAKRGERTCTERALLRALRVLSFPHQAGAGDRLRRQRRPSFGCQAASGTLLRKRPLLHKNLQLVATSESESPLCSDRARAFSRRCPTWGCRSGTFSHVSPIPRAPGPQAEEAESMARGARSSLTPSHTKVSSSLASQADSRPERALVQY